MAKNFMAYPELRHPYERKPLHGPGARTVLSQGQRFEVNNPGPGEGLKVDATTLEAITGFTLKPEGACLGPLCIPLNEKVLQVAGDTQWIDLEAFADLLEQPYVADRDAGVWSFGDIPEKRQQTLQDARAPDLEFTDRSGNVFNLADLKGRKALIVTWSSW